MLRARAVTLPITPDQLPIRLGGYAADVAAHQVDSGLEVNCLFLSDGCESAVLVSLDLLYVTQRLREAVLSRIEDLGVTAHNLFIAASHTHYAPAIDDTKPSLGEPEISYRNALVGIVIRAIREAALGPKTVVTLATAYGAAAIGVNRRRKRLLRLNRSTFEFNKAGMSPNSKGETDPVVSVIEVRAEGGIPLAFVWSAACHPTARGEADLISADWPGVVRGNLRKLVLAGDLRGAALPVLFLQGFSGDVRPPSGGTARLSAKGLLLRVMLGRGFLPMNSSEYSDWAHSAAERVASIARGCLPNTDESIVECARIELPASRFASGAEHLPPVSFHRISIGSLALIGASAELVSGYASRVRSLAPGMQVIPVGCLDHVIGYWPLRSMFREGGYEVVGHCPRFGITAHDPEIETTVLRQFRLVLDDAVRPTRDPSRCRSQEPEPSGRRRCPRTPTHTV